MRSQGLRWHCQCCVLYNRVRSRSLHEIWWQGPWLLDVLKVGAFCPLVVKLSQRGCNISLAVGRYKYLSDYTRNLSFSDRLLFTVGACSTTPVLFLRLKHSLRGIFILTKCS
jgi:hypothetical protein